MRLHRLFFCLCLLFSVGLGGCYRRVEIPRQTTPARATIALQISSSTLNISGGGADLLNTIRGDLIAKNIAVPVVAGGAADLTLKGEVGGVLNSSDSLEWELIDNKTGAIVATGHEKYVFDTSSGEMADAILLKIAQVDLNHYAAGGVTVMPAPRRPSLSAPDSATDGSKAWAVIIGVERYRNDLPSATHAEADALAFSTFAEKTLGVPRAHIKTLINDRATRTDITGALLEWLPRNAVEPGGVVYVFFSGHGAPDPETGDAYLIPYDADPAYLKTGGVAIKEVYDALEGLQGQTSMVFLDACFSGSGDRSVLAKGTRPLVPVKTPEVGGKVFSFGAAQSNQTTGAHEVTGHGLFSYHLLSGMSGAADADKNKDVTLDELAVYLKHHVETEARLQNRDQSPSFSFPDGAASGQMNIVEQLSE